MHPWLARQALAPGVTVPVRRLHALTRTWYADRLDEGWRPRERSDALRRFAQAGLEGPFWNPLGTSDEA